LEARDSSVQRLEEGEIGDMHREEKHSFVRPESGQRWAEI